MPKKLPLQDISLQICVADFKLLTVSGVSPEQLTPVIGRRVSANPTTTHICPFRICVPSDSEISVAVKTFILISRVQPGDDNNDICMNSNDKWVDTV